jgi:transposase
MPKQHDYTLNEEELKQIRQAMKHLDARVAKRATIIHSLHLGYRPEEVAQMHEVSLTTVYNHFNRFKMAGIEGLPDKAKSGRPAKATPEYIDRLEKTLEIDPKEKGYAFTIWTQPRLRSYLAQETGIELSRSRFQALMQRLGYRYRRPKRDLGHKQDPDLREQVKEALDELKKEPKQGSSSYSLWTKRPSD